MSLYDDASLIMYPSGYKANKIYSLKPTDGSGDLDFTRSNDTATRVNSDGLIEKVRTNLYTYSQSFADASWLTLSATKVSTSATDPNGDNTAANITWTSGTPRYFYKDFGNISPLTVSFWVKSNGGGNKFRLFGNGTNVFSADFTATSTWTRYSLSFNGSDVTGIGIAFASDNSAADLLVAFAQLEVGDVMTAYIPTTTTAVSVGMLADIPRIDYTGGGCGKLLLEPQRTNGILYSEQADNSYWIKFQCSITANQAISPDGYQNADLFTSTANGGAVIYKTCVTAGALSFFAKVGSLNANALFAISVDGVGGASWNQDGTLNAVAGGTATDGVSYGNGWFRFNYNVTSGSVVNYGLASSTDGDTAFIWGIQNEDSASYPTSYIPTLSAASTRGTDSCSKTGISSLIGQTEGTIFVDFVQKSVGASVVQIQLNDGSNSNRVQLEVNSSGIGVMYVFSGGALTGQINLGTFTTGTRYKVAIGYKVNDFVTYINGVSAGTDTNGAVPISMSRIDLGAEVGTPYTGYELNQALLFKTRLTNTQLAELTTI